MRDQVAINAKISAALKGRPATGRSFQSGFDPRRKILTDDDRRLAVARVAANRELIRASLPFERLSEDVRRATILAEQDGRCLHCGLNEWLGKPLLIEIDHINGNKYDNRRENLRGLCGNCHSQTPTFRNRKRN